MKAKYNDYRSSNYFIVSDLGLGVEILGYANTEKEIKELKRKFCVPVQIIKNENYTITNSIIHELSSEVKTSCTIRG